MKLSWDLPVSSSKFGEIKELFMDYQRDVENILTDEMKINYTRDRDKLIDKLIDNRNDMITKISDYLQKVIYYYHISNNN